MLSGLNPEPPYVLRQIPLSRGQELFPPHYPEQKIEPSYIPDQNSTLGSGESLSR